LFESAGMLAVRAPEAGRPEAGLFGAGLFEAGEVVLGHGESTEAVVAGVPFHDRAPAGKLDRVRHHRRLIYGGERVKLGHERGLAEFPQRGGPSHGGQRIPVRCPPVPDGPRFVGPTL
jgi:hypothetical protein